jgi:hypothetical protein
MNPQMANHADRGHAAWSASKTEQNWACAGAMALSEGVEDTTSVPADWGTISHEIGEACLSDPTLDAFDFVGDLRKGKVHEMEVDEEMAETTMAYVNYCRGRVAEYKSQTGKNALVFVEKRLSLESLDPPFDAGGTGDFIAIFPEWKLMEVVDLKTGRGKWVDANENKQARTYALGAMLAFKNHAVTHVMSTIVQPRIGNGLPRSETYHAVDLLEWTGDLLEKMSRSKAAMDAYLLVKAQELSLAEWASTYLTPGDHCDATFCKARGFCPALEQMAMDAAGIFLETDDTPRLANVETGDPDARARRLDMLDLLEGWIASVRALEHRKADMGDPATGYVLVAKEGREKWTDDAETQVLAAVKSAGLAEAKYLNPGKLKTPKQVRKALGDKAELLAGLSTTPTTGTNLVKASNTIRPVAPSRLENFIETNPFD